MKNLFLTFASVWLIVSVYSCRETEKKTEEGAQAVEAVKEDATKKMDEATDAIEETTDAAGEVIDEAGKTIEKDKLKEN